MKSFKKVIPGLEMSIVGIRKLHFKAFLFILFLIIPNFTQAEEFVFGPSNSTIKGSIRYAALGQYTASFQKYKGVLGYDVKQGVIKSVALTVDLASIKSNCVMCDDIIRSKRLMDVKKYPNIVFTNQKITKHNQEWFVDGFLQIHGVKKAVRFPFKAEIHLNKNSVKTLRVSGKWNIPRKDYGIVWSRTLDHAGVVVGDDVVVQWEVNILI